MVKKEVNVGSGIEDILLDITSDPISHDIRYGLAAAMCELIAKGKPDYIFTPPKSDDQSPIYWSDNLSLFLSDNLRANLELYELVNVAECIGWVCIEPTSRAKTLYEELKRRGRIDKNGYLDGYNSEV